MILNIRGTNGSGKSTLVRAIMDRYDGRAPVFQPKRSRPVGYVCTTSLRQSYVVGHYETPCGGGDTMDSMSAVFDAVTKWANDDYDVIFEGIISQDDVNRCAELNAEHRLLVIGLVVPIEECLAAVQARRRSRGDEREFNPTNTVNRARTLLRTMERLKSAGIDARWLNRDDALGLCIELLELPSQPLHDHSSVTPAGQRVLDFGV